MKKYIEIENIFAREVLDSRGNPTVEVEVFTKNGGYGRAIAPSGASTGSNEATELRDKDTKRFNGKGVLNAVSNVNNIISREIVGMNVLEQSVIDGYMNYMDGTKNKSSLGANAILAVSMAVAKAASTSLKVPLYMYLGGISGNVLPTPMMNVLNGGKHSDNNVNIQEFMIMPKNVELFSDKLRMCVEVYTALKAILKKDGLSTGVGDEGGFAPNLKSDVEAIEYIVKAIEFAGYENNFDLALDVAASEMYENGKYTFWKTGELFSADELINFYEELINKFPIVSIEDGLHEEDWSGWQSMTARLGKQIFLVGDDLFTTNSKRLQNGIEKNVANSILIKPNQIGTVTETIETINLAKDNGYVPIMSHRSGETEDTFIADFAVGLNLKYIKTGAPCRSERIAKYNRLLRIESEIQKVVYEE